jgi:hypothetical protein
MMANSYILKAWCSTLAVWQEFLSSPETFQTVSGADKSISTISTGANCKG